jgi:RHS repeat-associated protein
LLVENLIAALQSSAKIAGTQWGPGAVAYGAAGTPLVLTGSDLGGSGTVQFNAYKNGIPDTSVTPAQATVTMWTSNMLILTVPAGAYSGLVTVTVEGKTSNGLPFMVTPGSYAGTCPAGPSSTQLQITTASLHDGTANQTYSATLGATGGTSAYTWSITSGTLPSGLSLNTSTGTISGTPTAASGPVDLTFQVTDSSSPKQTNDAVLSLNIESQTLAPATVYNYAASYDGVGNAIDYTDTVMGTWSFGYDSLNRLISGTPSAGDFSGNNECWAYDPFGNRTAQASQTTACPTLPSVPAATIAYNGNNQITWIQTVAPTGLQYDAAGNALSAVTDIGQTYFIYDAEGRICAAQSTPVPGMTAMTGYLYGADGNRVAKGSITTMSCDPTTNGFQFQENYVLGPSGEELSMLDGNNNWQRTNVFVGGKLQATYDDAGLHFHLTDPLGTRRMQLSGNLAIGGLPATLGQPENDVQSLPFGDQLNTYPDQYAPATAGDATPLHFTGKERDTESGNDYFGARYYASSMGRFMSPDWSASVTPVPYAHLDDPQSLNLYSYVLNNPLSGVDADGHVCEDAEGACSGAGKDFFELRKFTDELFAGYGSAGAMQDAFPGAQQQTTGNIVYNETGGLRPEAKDGSGSSQDLHDSRVAVADVVDNRNKAGAKGGVASDAVSAKERNNPQYKDSQAAASEAANSHDRTGGSTHFYLDYGQPKPSWANGKATTSYGPFVNAAGGGDVPKGADVRIVIVHPEDQQ